MRILNLLFILLSVQSAWSQKTNEQLKISCIEPALLRQIISSDTAIASHSNRLVITNHDKDRRIVSIRTITDPQNSNVFDFKNIQQATVEDFYYDTTSKVIVKTTTKNNVILCGFSFKYDDKGRFLYKEGFGSGETRIRINYEYDSSGKLIKETIHRPSRTTIKAY